MEKLTVLVVDQNVSLADDLRDLLAKDKFRVFSAPSMAEGLSLVKRRMPFMAVVDQTLPGAEELKSLSEIRSIHPLCRVVIMTLSPTMPAAVRAVKAGAYDFIAKTPIARDLLPVIERAGVETAQKSKSDTFVLESATEPVERKIVGRSTQIQGIYRTIKKVAHTSATVLVHGESGTGKELIARAIHAFSNRKEGPFVTVNCAALPESLVESELFGFRQGAFTGAETNQKGKIIQAHNGTLVLDEIGEMDIGLQAKLLRVIQEKEVTPLGCEKPAQVNVRYIAVTNRNLFQRVREGKFREDLFYRLNVIPIQVPPLREHKEDIPLLVHHFIEKYAHEYQVKVNKMAPDAMDLLMEQDWAGNARELEHSIEKAILLTENNTITAADLRICLPELGRHNLGGRIVIDVGTSLQEVEKQLLLATLKQVNGNELEAARVLRISVPALKNRISEYATGWNRPEPKGPPHGSDSEDAGQTLKIRRTPMAGRLG